mgnify:CR=1 FL=1
MASGCGGQAVSVKLELCCSVQYKGSLKQGIRSQNGHVMQLCHVCASAGVRPWQPLWAGSLSYAGGTASVTQASWMRTGTTLLARVLVWSKVSNRAAVCLRQTDGPSADITLLVSYRTLTCSRHCSLARWLSCNIMFCVLFDVTAACLPFLQGIISGLERDLPLSTLRIPIKGCIQVGSNPSSDYQSVHVCTSLNDQWLLLSYPRQT